MKAQTANPRYKTESGSIVLEVAVKTSRQLFNERDPAPFRERDLDEKFVSYLVSAVQEFSLQTKLKIHLLTADPTDLTEAHAQTIREAIRTYFEYEALLSQSRLRGRLRTGRSFALIGFTTLFVCLTASEFINSLELGVGFSNILSTGFVIIGWVAVWHPIESLLYGWRPIREQRQYYEKIAKIDLEISLSE